VSAPSIGLDDVVLNDDRRSALAQGPGLALGSPSRAASGAIVIVGHRTTFGGPFGHLGALKTNDYVALRSAKAVSCTYAVVRVIKTSPRVHLDTSGRPMRYLVTTGSTYGDHRRLVVEAWLTGTPAVGLAAPSVTLPALPGSAADALLGLLVLAVLVVGWIVRTRQRQSWPGWARTGAWLVAGFLTVGCWHLMLGSQSPLL